MSLLNPGLMGGALPILAVGAAATVVTSHSDEREVKAEHRYKELKEEIRRREEWYKEIERRQQQAELEARREAIVRFMEAQEFRREMAQRERRMRLGCRTLDEWVQRSGHDDERIRTPTARPVASEEADDADIPIAVAIEALTLDSDATEDDATLTQ